ncbi:hypothetical protein TWF694_011371 [Orbilia ellipsospora]|uniref:Uncharacterized protein n=1 Tax=Orbilia ellipsospora TaxID=2528407 RepID=A0AAV9X522_9PEZI
MKITYVLILLSTGIINQIHSAKIDQKILEQQQNLIDKRASKGEKQLKKLIDKSSKTIKQLDETKNDKHPYDPNEDINTLVGFKFSKKTLPLVFDIVNRGEAAGKLFTHLTLRIKKPRTAFIGNVFAKSCKDVPLFFSSIRYELNWCEPTYTPCRDPGIAFRKDLYRCPTPIEMAKEDIEDIIALRYKADASMKVQSFDIAAERSHSLIITQNGGVKYPDPVQLCEAPDECLMDPLTHKRVRMWKGKQIPFRTDAEEWIQEDAKTFRVRFIKALLESKLFQYTPAQIEQLRKLSAAQIDVLNEMWPKNREKTLDDYLNGRPIPGFGN